MTSTISEVEICNRALIRVDGRTLTSLDQEEDEAIYCSLLYPQIRDEVLRAHFWNFAIKQATLNQLAETPGFEFKYKYALPHDYIRIYKMEQERHRYKIKGPELHTDLSTCNIEYVAQITDTTKFDPMFVTAVSMRLAAELAYPIAGSAERANQIMADYKDFLKEAKRRDGQEGTPDPLTAELFVDSRFGFGDIDTGYYS